MFEKHKITVSNIHLDKPIYTDNMSCDESKIALNFRNIANTKSKNYYKGIDYEIISNMFRIIQQNFTICDVTCGIICNIGSNSNNFK